MKKKLKLEHIATNRNRFGTISYQKLPEYREYIAQLYEIANRNNYPLTRIKIDLFKMKDLDTNEECWIINRGLFIDDKKGWQSSFLYSNDNMQTWYPADIVIPVENPFYEVYTVNFNVKLNRYMEVIEHD
jgi:hypothetical protein